MTPGERIIARNAPQAYGTLTLADLAHDRPTVIATSSVGASGQNRWSYLLDRHNISALMLARENGAVITVQAKMAENVYELRAWLSRRKRA